MIYVIILYRIGICIILCASRRVLVSWLKLRAEAEGHTQQKMDSGFALLQQCRRVTEGGKAAADG